MRKRIWNIHADWHPVLIPHYNAFYKQLYILADKTKFIGLTEEYDGDVEKAARVKFVEEPGICVPILS